MARLALVAGLQTMSQLCTPGLSLVSLFPSASGQCGSWSRTDKTQLSLALCVQFCACKMHFPTFIWLCYLSHTIMAGDKEPGQKTKKTLTFVEVALTKGLSETEHLSDHGTVHHICAFCLRNTGKHCNHPENKCPRKGYTEKDTVPSEEL